MSNSLTKKGIFIPILSGVVIGMTACSHYAKMSEEDREGYYLSADETRQRGGVGNYVERYASEDVQNNEQSADQAEQTSAAESEVAESDTITDTTITSSSTTTEATTEIGDNKLLFPFGSAELDPSAKEEIASMAEDLKGNEKIRIEGYADSVGSAESNKILSRNRAASVKDVLVQNGLEENQIIIFAGGENKPVASNDSEDGRALNRRVEIHSMEEMS